MHATATIAIHALVELQNIAFESDVLFPVDLGLGPHEARCQIVPRVPPPFTSVASPTKKTAPLLAIQFRMNSEGPVDWRGHGKALVQNLRYKQPLEEIIAYCETCLAFAFDGMRSPVRGPEHILLFWENGGQTIECAAGELTMTFTTTIVVPAAGRTALTEIASKMQGLRDFSGPSFYHLRKSADYDLELIHRCIHAAIALDHLMGQLIIHRVDRNMTLAKIGFSLRAKMLQAHFKLSSQWDELNFRKFAKLRNRVMHEGACDDGLGFIRQTRWRFGQLINAAAAIENPPNWTHVNPSRDPFR